DRYPMTQVRAKLHQVLLAERLDGLVLAVDLLEDVLERFGVVLAIARIVRIDRLPDLEAETGTGPTQMSLQDLADVHAARHAERVQHDVNRRSVLEERH